MTQTDSAASNNGSDEEAYQRKAREERADDLLRRYNSLLPSSSDEQYMLLKEVLGSIGEGSEIRPPFYFERGYNIEIARDVMVDFNCTIMDYAKVTIGDFARIGPRVLILTDDPPSQSAQRQHDPTHTRCVHIRAYAVIGGGALIHPGVTIGDNAIVGAGAVVTTDVPPGAKVAGNPAKLLP